MNVFKRNHRKSDTDLRGRRSLDAIRALAQARSSEQIQRHPPLSSRPHTPHGSHQEPERLNSASTDSPRQKYAPRFNLLRARNASDSALGVRARDPNPPPLPTSSPALPPAIITTSPTNDVIADNPPAATLKRSGTMRLWRRDRQELPRPSIDKPSLSETSSQRSSLSARRKNGASRNNSHQRLSRVTFDEPERPQTLSTTYSEPPPYDDQNSTLPLPGPRLSESSRSTASSGDHPIAYSTTTTTHTTTTTTFFRLPRRKRKDAPLFPLPSRNPEVVHSDVDSELTPQARRHSMASPPSSTPNSPVKPQHDAQDRAVSTVLAASSLGMAGHGVPILRSNSMASSANSGGTSTPGSPKRNMSVRGRSSTMTSIDQSGGKNGKTAFGGFLDRIRRDSEPTSVPSGSSPQPHLAFSTPSSRGASRDLFIPERNDEDTPPVYLSKLFDAVSKSVVASLLARNGDPFHQAVLTAYMETFDFENDPMDMALRRLLMEVELPAEAQQIDRVLQAFSDRYHDCNPFIYQDSDQAYLIAFSLIMLHTDFFNKNNKHKMQKADYIKNTSRSISKDGISDDILECFYANITYTPFIRMEDEYDINGEKIVPHRPRKGIFHRTINAYDGRRMKEPIDPYLLIIDNQLDLLRTSLKDVVQFEDPYTYSGTASRLDMASLHKAFFRSGVLQIVSARSRPDAFMTQATVDNPEGADPGVVEMKVTKVGILWRKDVKRKKTRSPWQEWGAILTGSQLYFFRNVGWVKSLMGQYEAHHKLGSGTPVLFKPPLEDFKPDAQISTDDAVALLDKSYKKHKNAFAFFRHGGVHEYFIADSEAEMNDWLHKLNYAATFRTAGVRMRGVVGGNYEGQRSRGMRRMEAATGSPTGDHIQTPTGEVSVIRGGIDSKLANEIAAARREIVERRIFDSEERIAVANRELQMYLRNGRHLAILTPIPPRAREQVIMAAGTLAAKLCWIRIEMWKLRCHRDILALDLEEERKSARDLNKRITAIVSPVTPISSRSLPAPVTSTNGTSPSTLGSPASSAPTRTSPLHSAQGSPVVGGMSGDTTPTQASFIPVPDGDITRRISTRASNNSEASRGRARESIVSTSARSPSASSKGRDLSIAGTDDTTNRGRRSPTPTMSESSFGASVDQEKEGEEDKEKLREKEKGKSKEKDSSRQHIRRSLQRTLRETQSLGHKRNKSTEDPSATDKKSGTDEGLPRGTGSFTVHGKKASVITFGSEWQTMSTEDRLRRKTATEAENAADAESLNGLLSYSRRGSQQTVQGNVGSRDRDSLTAPLPMSRRGSHVNTGAPEELPEVPEGSMMEDELLARLGTLTRSDSVRSDKKHLEPEIIRGEVTVGIA